MAHASQPYDVAVVGAGPAGSAAALRVLQDRPEARVLLLDAAAFPRDKTCGDGISSHALAVYDHLGVGDVGAGYPPVPVLRVRSPAGREVARAMSRPARVIPREVFDARLVDAACARGAHLRRHRVRGIEVRPDRVVVDGSIEARVLIGADGAHSTVRRLLGVAPQRGGTVALAIRGYTDVQAADATDLLIAVSGEDCPAYAWSFPLPDGRSNVGFGVFADRLSGGKAELLARLDATLPGQAPEPGTVRAYQLPLSTGRAALPDGRVLLVGDAAGLVNPITGEGIYYAALSGLLAADATRYDAVAGTHYRLGLHRVLNRHHRHTDVLAVCARSPRFVDATVAASAARSEVFDAVVELGLGRGTASPRPLAIITARYLREVLGAARRPRHDDRLVEPARRR